MTTSKLEETVYSTLIGDTQLIGLLPKKDKSNVCNAAITSGVNFKLISPFIDF